MHGILKVNFLREGLEKLYLNTDSVPKIETPCIYLLQLINAS